MTEKGNKMSEDTKLHKINVVVTTNSDWKSDDVADTIKELLEMENDVEDPSFTEISAISDPTNNDMGIRDSIEESLEILSIYCAFLKMKLEEAKVMDMFNEGMSMIEHGITDIKACARCVQTFSSKLVPNDIKIAKLGLKDLEDAPEEILHAIAHVMGLEAGACQTMSRSDMLEWIKNSMRGEPRTIN